MVNALERGKSWIEILSQLLWIFFSGPFSIEHNLIACRKQRSMHWIFSADILSTIWRYIADLAASGNWSKKWRWKWSKAWKFESRKVLAVASDSVGCQLLSRMCHYNPIYPQMLSGEKSWTTISQQKLAICCQEYSWTAFQVGFWRLKLLC